MDQDIVGKLFIPIGGEDFISNYADFGLTFDSSETDILSAIRAVVTERFGVDIGSPQQGLYKTRKATDTRNIYVIPNSVAG